MKRSHVWFIVSACLVAACSEGGAPPSARSQQPIVDPATGDDTGSTEAPPGSSQVDGIDWAAARAHRPFDAGIMRPEERAEIDSVTLPVLLPNDPALLASANVTSGPDWYAASMRGDGVRVMVHGTNRSVSQPSLANDVPPDRRPAPGEATVSRMDGIVHAAFVQFGAAYTVDVECEPPTDARCTDDAYVNGLLERFGFAGGRP